MVDQQKENLKSLAIKLHEIEAIKFSIKSPPIDFDLSIMIKYPDVMVSFAHFCDLF